MIKSTKFSALVVGDTIRPVGGTLQDDEIIVRKEVCGGQIRLTLERCCNGEIRRVTAPADSFLGGARV